MSSTELTKYICKVTNTKSLTICSLISASATAVRKGRSVRAEGIVSPILLGHFLMVSLYEAYLTIEDNITQLGDVACR